MAAGIVRIDAGNIAGDIEDAEPLEVSQLRGNLGTEPAVSQPHVDDGKVGQVAPAERDRLSHGAADAADLVPMLDEDVLAHIGDHEIVLSYQNLQHEPMPFTGWQIGRLADWEGRALPVHTFLVG